MQGTVPYDKIFLLSLLGLMKQVTARTHTQTHTPLNLKCSVTAVTLRKRHCPLSFPLRLLLSRSGDKEAEGFLPEVGDGGAWRH